MGFVPRTLVINAPTQEVQLPFNIRFLTGSTILDAKAEGDLGQLVNQLARLELQGLEVHLIGYTDETGLSEVNMILSEERAEAVSRELLARGVRQSIITEGLGESNPVASNETVEGRARNRRIEIWVRTKQ